MRGDANGDKVVDVSDVITILGLLFRSVPETIGCEKAADTDDSGFVEITDAVFLLRNLFSGGAGIPAPADCGVDPTADALACETFDRCDGAQ